MAVGAQATAILYSFRRCPYAIRARLALAVAGLRPGIDLELREVNLRARPPELPEVSPKATVPVLVLPDGRVLEESLAIMLWALGRHDPQGWLQCPQAAERFRSDGPAPRSIPAAAAGSDGAQAGADAVHARASDRRAALAGGDHPACPAPIAELIAQNDGPFKHHLDRFRYPERFLAEVTSAGIDHPAGFAEGSRPRPGSAAGSQATTDGGIAQAASIAEREVWRQGHRQAALAILRQWNGRLRGSDWLLGNRPCLADVALVPFVRQFQLADPHGFAAEADLAPLRDWLERLLAWPLLVAAMEAPWGPRRCWRSPRWLYHLALAQEWSQARAEGIYRRSTRGLSLEQVGFVHACQDHQLAATHRRFYADLPASAVRLLILDPQRLAALGVPVRQEPAPGLGELFPHLYGALPLEAVLLAEPYAP